MDNGYITGALLLDLRKDFDTVNHSVLTNKVSLLSPSEMFFKWINSYLTERQKVVDFRGTLSRTAFLATGVPEGSILGPLLFLINDSDLPSAINTKTIMFADDTACRSKGESVANVTSSIQGTLNHINDYAKENHLVPHSDIKPR